MNDGLAIKLTAMWEIFFLEMFESRLSPNPRKKHNLDSRSIFKQVFLPCHSQFHQKTFYEQLFLYRGDLDSFSVITVCVCNFLKKEIGKKKPPHKMLVKLPTGRF